MANSLAFTKSSSIGTLTQFVGSLREEGLYAYPASARSDSINKVLQVYFDKVEGNVANNNIVFIGSLPSAFTEKLVEPLTLSQRFFARNVAVIELLKVSSKQGDVVLAPFLPRDFSTTGEKYFGDPALKALQVRGWDVPDEIEKILEKKKDTIQGFVPWSESFFLPEYLKELVIELNNYRNPFEPVSGFELVQRITQERNRLWEDLLSKIDFEMDPYSDQKQRRIPADLYGLTETQIGNAIASQLLLWSSKEENSSEMPSSLLYSERRPLSYEAIEIIRKIAELSAICLELEIKRIKSIVSSLREFSKSPDKEEWERMSAAQQKELFNRKCYVLSPSFGYAGVYQPIKSQTDKEIVAYVTPKPPVQARL